MFAVLRESLGEGGKVTNRSRSQFGICAAPGDHSDSSLEFLKETSKGKWPQILHPTAGETLNTEYFKAAFSPHSLLSLPAAVSEDTESGTLGLTFDVPPSGWQKLSPVLLLAFESPPAGNLQVTFSSGSLQPDKQVKTRHPDASMTATDDLL